MTAFLPPDAASLLFAYNVPRRKERHGKEED